MLNGSGNIHSQQSPNGQRFNQNDYLIFTRQCLNPEAVTYEFEFFRAPADADDGHLEADVQPFASAFLLPLDANKTVGDATAAVIDYQHKVVGQVRGWKQLHAQLRNTNMLMNPVLLLSGPLSLFVVGDQ